jgi:hypothetical protein
MNPNQSTNKQRRSPTKRAALIAIGVLGALITLVVIGVGATLLALRTDWGGERLRRQIVSRANARIQGHLEIKRLSFGGNRLVVWGVALRDPEGQMVAQIARTEVDVSLSRVLHKELRLTAVEIESPVLDLIAGEQGLNLSRAMAPQKATKKKPTAPSARTTKEGWVIRLDRFALTGGELALATAQADGRDTRVHVSELNLAVSLRYATGNGALDLKLKLDGDDQLAPGHPLRLALETSAHGDVYRFDGEGELLGGSLRAHGTVDAHRLANADAVVALAIPRQALAGQEWGPFGIDATAHPGAPPTLNALLAIPGLELAARTRENNDADPGSASTPASTPASRINGRLTVADLSLTGQAIQALSGKAAPKLAGHGALNFALDQPAGAAIAPPAAARLDGSFDSLDLGSNAIARLKIEGQAAPLSGLPSRADLAVTASSVTAGTTTLGALALSFKLRAQDVAADFSVASPARVDVKAAGRIDDDRHGGALDRLTIAFPGDRWTSQGTTLLRFENTALSVTNFRLASGQQVLAIDGSKHAEDIAGHLALTGFRLGRLPAALVDPALRLDGQVDADIKASGRTDAPRLEAKVALKQARYQGFSKIDATLVAALHDQRVDGTATVEAPFLRAQAAVNAATQAPAPGAPIDVRLDVRHVDVSQVLRAAQKEPLGDGRINLKLHLKGSADQPDLDLLVDGVDLAVSRPVKAARPSGQEPVKDTRPIDVGQARVHLTYVHRAARLNIDFRSAHGGTLLVEAAAHVSLSYPRLPQERLAIARIPVRGKVVARDLDVAWIARFSPRVESLGGQVTADARLAGTVGDPQFVGDVRWKNGQVITTGSAPAAAPGPAGRRPAAGRPSSSTR